jgi:hypothetical protein
MRDDWRGQEDLRQLLHPYVAGLLQEMFASWESWRPRLSYPKHAAGLTCGGSVYGSWDDLVADFEGVELLVVETAFTDLDQAQRIALEVALGVLPRVWRFRQPIEELVVEAGAKIEQKCLAEGLL